jgi:parallel beta-helix repeat protein
VRRTSFKARLLPFAVLATLTLAPSYVSTASAAVLSCGDIILVDTVLENDVGPCSTTNGNGITVGANNITFDLNGHTISGVNGQPREGAGVYVNGRTGVTVKNGTVRYFDGGVVIEGGSGNTVTGIHAHDNIGSLNVTRFGDGISIMCSRNNTITANVAVHNGTFSGIGIYSRTTGSEQPCLVALTSTGNVISNNTVRDNNLPRTAQVNDDDGIRLEAMSSFNTITGNTVSGSALDGIALLSFTPDNTITNNTVYNNGFLNTFRRRGDGIRVFGGSDRTVVENNTVFGNAANGIILHGPFAQPNGMLRPGATGGRVVGNYSANNNVLPPLENLVVPPGTSQLGGPTFDLHDGNPNCDANVWLRNIYRTAFPACTTTGGFKI